MGVKLVQVPTVGGDWLVSAAGATTVAGHFFVCANVKTQIFDNDTQSGIILTIWNNGQKRSVFRLREDNIISGAVRCDFMMQTGPGQVSSDARAISQLSVAQAVNRWIWCAGIQSSSDEMIAYVERRQFQGVDFANEIPGTLTLYVGRRGPAGLYQTNHIIDRLAIFSTPPNEADIEYLRRGGDPRDVGSGVLAHMYPFDSESIFKDVVGGADLSVGEGSPTIVDDSAPNPRPQIGPSTGL